MSDTPPPDNSSDPPPPSISRQPLVETPSKESNQIVEEKAQNKISTPDIIALVISVLALIASVYAIFKDDLAPPEIRVHYPALINVILRKNNTMECVLPISFSNHSPAHGTVRSLNMDLLDSTGKLIESEPWWWFVKNEREHPDSSTTVFIKEYDAYPIILNGQKEDWKNIKFSFDTKFTNAIKGEFKVTFIASLDNKQNDTIQHFYFRIPPNATNDNGVYRCELIRIYKKDE